MKKRLNVDLAVVNHRNIVLIDSNVTSVSFWRQDSQHNNTQHNDITIVIKTQH